jgi:hypothetical protein
VKIPNESEYLALRLNIAALIGYIEGINGLLSADIQQELVKRASDVATLVGMPIITQAAKLQGEIL